MKEMSSRVEGQVLQAVEAGVGVSDAQVPGEPSNSVECTHSRSAQFPAQLLCCRVQTHLHTECVGQGLSVVLPQSRWAATTVRCHKVLLLPCNMLAQHGPAAAQDA